MAVVELTKDTFEKTVSDNPFVLVDFWAPWCGPCRGFAPVYEEVSEEYQDIVFAKVNTEDERELAGYFQIRSIPTLMIIRDKVVLHSQAGALPRQALEDMIRQAREIDMEKVHKEVAEEQEQASDA